MRSIPVVALLTLLTMSHSVFAIRPIVKCEIKFFGQLTKEDEQGGTRREVLLRGGPVFQTTLFGETVLESTEVKDKIRIEHRALRLNTQIGDTGLTAMAWTKEERAVLTDDQGKVVRAAKRSVLKGELDHSDVEVAFKAVGTVIGGEPFAANAKENGWEEITFSPPDMPVFTYPNKEVFVETPSGQGLLKASCEWN